MDYFKILPTDITLDILTLLPTESVIDSKLVCTNWRRIVSHHPLFSTKHFHHLNHPFDSSAADSGKLGFLAKLGDGDHTFVYFENNVNYDETDESKKTIQGIRRMNLTPPFFARFGGSVNGLICLYQDSPICICNPITREYVMLPEFETDCYDDNKYHFYDWKTQFGYVSLTDEYKVVRIYKSKTHFEVQVYTLGSGTGWRNLTNLVSPFDCEFSIHKWDSDGVFANGALYWLDAKSRRIVIFHLAEEKFSGHLSPPSLPPESDWEFARLGVFDGFLSFSIGLDDKEDAFTGVWLLKKKNDIHDVKERDECQSLVWSLEFRIDGSDLLAFTKNGGVLTYEDNYLSVYDTKTSTSKMIVAFMCYFRRIFPHKNTFVSLKELGEQDTKVMKPVSIWETKSQYNYYQFKELQEDESP